MTIDLDFRRKCSKKGRNTTRKIGIRSISDIIANKNMILSKKINYIRHHYTYYEGNYDLFVTEKGTPNARKWALNKLISDIIFGKKDASELKEFNKQILEWRKEVDKLEIKRKEVILSNFDGSSYKERMQWEKDIENAKGTAKIYIDLILNYLQENPEEVNICKLLSYKEMKKKAIEWNINHELKLEFKEKSKEDLTELTPGEIFKFNYLKTLGNNPASIYLDLVVLYLNSDKNKRYKKEYLENNKSIGNFKEAAIQWGILEYINGNEEIIDLVENKLCETAKNIIKQRAGIFQEDEDKRAYKLMKKCSEDMGYSTQEKVTINE